MKSFTGTNIIRMLTGMRRSGKSTLLKIYQNALKNTGVRDDQILEINLEDLRFEELKDYRKLYGYINEHLNISEKAYLFLDEIQEVENFEKVLSSLQLQENLEIIVTGSNSKMLSGELATYISGRYVEIPVYPFSFSEFLKMRPGNARERFDEYLQTGGLPASILLDSYAHREYLRGIFNTVLLKDVMQRKALKDASLLESLSIYLADNISNPISSKRVADFLTSNGRKTTPKTIDSYLDALQEAFLVYPAARYDIRGKKSLKREQKYYFADIGIRQFLIGEQFRDYGRLLENVVFLELRRRGYSVTTGKNQDQEIDFIARKGADIRYYQVSAIVAADDTRERKLGAFARIDDNYPKILLTLDTIPMTSGGILHQNIIDFLLEEDHSNA